MEDVRERQKALMAKLGATLEKRHAIEKSFSIFPAHSVILRKPYPLLKEALMGIRSRIVSVHLLNS